MFLSKVLIKDLLINKWTITGLIVIFLVFRAYYKGRRDEREKHLKKNA